MMGLNQVEFVHSCLEDYELLMEDKFFSVKSIKDLEQCHQLLKKQLIAQLPVKWTKLTSGKMPPNISGMFSKELEEAFKQLKGHFEKSQIRDFNMGSAASAKQAAVKYYTDEMDKWVDNHPHASQNELQTQHGNVAAKALETAKSAGGATLTAQTFVELREELDSRHIMYKYRAEMNLKSLADPAIGIDLGTTNCCVMVYHKNKIIMVPNRAQGNSSTTPSYVAFQDDDTDTFGKVAKEEAFRYPEQTIYDAKRMIGRPWDDHHLQADMKKWPFEVVNENGNPKIKAFGRTRYPHEISARLLTRFRKMAEEHLHLASGTIRKAVITVPAYFTEPQRRATSEAAQCAGLQVLNILSEPTAAAIAYSWERRDTSDTRKALIYDLGGGTFDVAIAEVKPDGVEILGVDGDTHLGGQDFDQLMMDYCLQEFKTKEGVDLEADRISSQTTTKNQAKRAICRLKLQCEIAKERLSTSNKTTVQVDSICRDKDLVVKITKDKLEQILSHLVQKTIDIVERSLNSVKAKGVKSKSDIDDVILVGGSTRMPLVMKKLEEYFDGKQLNKHINPDEAVAYGAAVQAAILNNEENVKRISVQDVTPLPLGISVEADERFAEVVPKNAQIPCQHRRRFVTYEDNQQKIKVAVFQGESSLCKDNKQLGDFILEGLPPKRAEEEKIWVKMTIDANGILQVEAESISTAKKNAITIKAERLGMNDVDIERVKNECELLTYAG